MNDREMLELAAKAAGYAVEWAPEWECYMLYDPAADLWSSWHPREDDGDALRLAVKLNLSIITGWGFDGKPGGTVATMLGSGEDLDLTRVSHGSDACAAWRESILIAAAEIGKAMQENQSGPVAGKECK